MALSYWLKFEKNFPPDTKNKFVYPQVIFVLEVAQAFDKKINNSTNQDIARCLKGFLTSSSTNSFAGVKDKVRALGIKGPR